MPTGLRDVVDFIGGVLFLALCAVAMLSKGFGTKLWNMCFSRLARFKFV